MIDFTQFDSLLQVADYFTTNDICKQTIAEARWAHFKRVIFSTYHCVSKDYVQRYIDEQAYRWNTRKMSASYRFEDMFKKAVKHFEYADVLSLSSVIDVVAWKTKHDSYYWAGKVA